MIEKVKVTLELPKAVVDFIQAVDKPESIETYLVEHFVETMESYCELLESSPGVLMDKFNLKPIFKAYDCLPAVYESAEES